MTAHENEETRDDALRAEFAKLAQEPVGRGPKAEELWARAAVVRRLEARSALGPERSAASLVWGPLAGAVAALVLAAVVWLTVGGLRPGVPGDAVTLVLWIAAGSLGALGLAACSSLALLWQDL